MRNIFFSCLLHDDCDNRKKSVLEYLHWIRDHQTERSQTIIIIIIIFQHCQSSLFSPCHDYIAICSLESRARASFPSSSGFYLLTTNFSSLNRRVCMWESTRSFSCFSWKIICEHWKKILFKDCKLLQTRLSLAFERLNSLVDCELQKRENRYFSWYFHVCDLCILTTEIPR